MDWYFFRFWSSYASRFKRRMGKWSLVMDSLRITRMQQECMVQQELRLYNCKLQCPFQLTRTIPHYLTILSYLRSIRTAAIHCTLFKVEHRQRWSCDNTYQYLRTCRTRYIHISIRTRIRTLDTTIQRIVGKCKNSVYIFRFWGDSNIASFKGLRKFISHSVV